MSPIARIVLISLLYALSVRCISIPQLYKTENITSLANRTFDYVIVGGGTAGLTIATRLSEQANVSVAVIEAGGNYELDHGNLSTVPAYWSQGAGTAVPHPDLNVYWGFKTLPQTSLNRSFTYPRGKTLGGCSAVNTLFYQRPSVGTLAQWARQVGDDSYRWENFLPFYKKAVTYNKPRLAYTNSTNEQDPTAWPAPGKGGPLQISFGKYIDPYASWVQPVFEKVGMKALRGFASGKMIGSAYSPFTVDPVTAKRSSSASSYLTSAQNRTNLHVFTKTMAEKIIFKNKRATGVRVSSSNRTFILHARKEVVISAGAIQSPQLLMVSGIGPKTELSKFKITVLADRPGVGQNLADHVFFSTAFPINLPTFSTALNNPSVFSQFRDLYNNNASGPLTIPFTGFSGAEKLPVPYRASLSNSSLTSLSTYPRDWPELQYFAIAAVLGYNRDYATEDPLDGGNYASLTTALVAPQSKGSITLSSPSMSVPPKIDFAFLTHPTDLQVLIAAFKRNRAIWSALSNLTVGPERIPGPNTTTDRQIERFLQESIGPVYHASATCRMGRRSDPGAVVDNHAKVIGVQGLRVVDASAFPFLLPGVPQASVYALAEKIAEDVKRGI